MRLPQLCSIKLLTQLVLSILPFSVYKYVFPKNRHNKIEIHAESGSHPNDSPCYHFYGFGSVEEYFKDLKLKSTNPGYVIHKNATYNPCEGNPFINSGLYDSNGAIIEESCLFRGINKTEMISAKTDKTFSKRILKGSYIYGGPIVAHYGHFMTECISRLWYLLEQDKNDSFLLFHGNDFALRSNFIKKILNVLPIDEDRITVLDSAAQLSEVVIPLPSMINRGEIHKIHKKLPVRVAEAILNSKRNEQTDQPLYLSRRKLPVQLRKILNESKLEKRLTDYNVKIIYPEELSFSEQVTLFNRHSVIIGPLGSAHHTNLFSQKKLTQIYLCHSSKMKNYYMIDYINNNFSHYIMCCYSPFWNNNYQQDNSMIFDIDYVISCLKSIGVI
jgi:hypothetical protein